MKSTRPIEHPCPKGRQVARMSIEDSLPDSRQAYGKIKQPPWAAH